MKLKIKFVDWSAGFPVSILHQETAKKIGASLRDRVVLSRGMLSKKISTILDISTKLVKRNQILISSEVRNITNFKNNQLVEVNLSPSPKSIIHIKRKLDGKRLDEKQIKEIIFDVVNNSLSEPEVALFVSAMYNKGMNHEEVISLTKAILTTGKSLKLRNKFVVDKHSIGGIPGNRTSPIVVAICAAGGLTMPKSSSRAITSSAGTADVMETICQVDFSLKEVQKIIKKTKGCFIWGGALGLVPADSKIIRVEKTLHLDPEAQLLASIMAKKLAMGAEYIVIDIPFGKNAKVGKARALRLKTKFERLGKSFGKKIRVILFETNGPMGTGVGPALELLDVIDVLTPGNKCAGDLEEKSLILAGELFEMTGKAKKNQGKRLAKEILDSGKAFKKFKEIIKAQKGSLKEIKLEKFKCNIISKKSGKIISINSKKINLIARLLGCPLNKFAGIKMHVFTKNHIKKGEKIATLYSGSSSRLNHARDFFNSNETIKIN